MPPDDRSSRRRSPTGGAPHDSGTEADRAHADPELGPSDSEFSLSIGDDLIAEALAAVERRAEASKAARRASVRHDDEEDDVEVVFDDDDGGDDAEDIEGMTVDLGDLDALMAPHGDAPESDKLSGSGATSGALRIAQQALESTMEALEAAEQARFDAEAERDDALKARARSRRTARKYKDALEKEVEQRKRLGSTQKLLRDRLARAESRVEDAEEEHQTLIRQAQGLTTDVERLQRDVQRLKSREAQAKAAATRKAYERACKALLPVLDNLQLALAHGTESPEKLLSGLSMVASQFSGALESVGLERVQADKGTPFDPTCHEAMQIVETDEVADNAVVTELQAGFSFEGRLLRAARVTVGRRPAHAPPVPAVSPAPDPEDGFAAALQEDADETVEVARPVPAEAAASAAEAEGGPSATATIPPAPDVPAVAQAPVADPPASSSIDSESEA